MISKSKQDLIDKLQKTIDDAQNDINTILEMENDYRVERLATVRDRVRTMPKEIKYETGLRWFDDVSGGFSEGSFINLAGESYGGKTTFVLEILKNISKYNSVLFFSYEMYERRLDKKLGALTEVQENNFLIEQKRNELSQIESIIRSYCETGGRFIAIDSRMKINVSGKQEEYQKNSEISSRLSKLCQETGAIILLINQISEGDLRSGRMSLKGSGDQKYDSDMVLFIVVDEEEKRFMYCTKDRDGGKWKREIPSIDTNVTETTYTYDKKEFM